MIVVVGISAVNIAAHFGNALFAVVDVKACFWATLQINGGAEIEGELFDKPNHGLMGIRGAAKDEIDRTC